MIFKRLDPTEQKAGLPGTRSTPLSPLKDIEVAANEKLDPWLPQIGQPLSARRVIGLLMLLPLMFAARGFIGYLSSYCLGWVSERVINDLRLDVLIKLNSLSAIY
jgi:hypothetical protein